MPPETIPINKQGALMRLELERLTLDELFEKAVQKYAGNDALAIAGQLPITYRQFADKVKEVKLLLQRIKSRKGDKILLLGYNSPNWCFAYIAITTSGAVAVPVLVDFPEADINHIIRHSGASAAFISESIYSALDLEPLRDFRYIFSLENFSVLNESENSEPEKIKSKKLKQIHIKEDDLAEILYTSGTTGHSKGVMLSHKNIVSNTVAGIETLKATREDSVILSVLPLAHSYGCTCTFLGNVYSGSCLHFLARKPSPKILLDAMQKVRPTVLTGVPLVFEKIYHKRVLPEISQKKLLRWMLRFKFGRKFLYRAAGKKILEMFGGRLEVAVIGGASLNSEVETFLREGGIPFTNGYGLSECSPLVAGVPEPETKTGSVGRPVQGVEVKIIDKDPETGIGEIYVNGANVMQGYYKNPEENEKVFSEDGWLITGDRGYLDEENYLFITGRSKNIIVGPSGENIYPEVIEDKFKESPYVEEVLVYEDDGQIVARIYPDYDYIVKVHHDKSESALKKEIEATFEELRKEANSKLPTFSQVNRIVEQSEPFEKTPTNKIKRLLYIPK